MESEEDSDLSSTDEEEEDNENVEKIEAAKKVPADITVENQIFDIDIHPSKSVIASGEISGKVSIHSYSNDSNKLLLENSNHKKACRSVSFSLNGERLYSSSKDKALQTIDLNTGTLLNSIQRAHEKAINCLKVVGENYIISGSDDGVVKMWDTRTFTAMAEFSDFKDYISDMSCDKDNKYLLCTSGDGVLSVLNLRKKVLEHASDQLDEELLSIAILKNGTKVGCGSTDGVLNIYGWGEWGDISDRVPMEKDSIDAILPLNDDLICTGIGNGQIKCWYIQPHKYVGCIGTHGKLGIESLALSSDKQILASAASEKTIKFWDVSALHNTCKPSAHEKNNRKRKLDASGKDENNFFDDL